MLDANRDSCWVGYLWLIFQIRGLHIMVNVLRPFLEQLNVLRCYQQIFSLIIWFSLSGDRFVLHFVSHLFWFILNCSRLICHISEWLSVLHRGHWLRDTLCQHEEHFFVHWRAKNLILAFFLFRLCLQLLPYVLEFYEALNFLFLDILFTRLLLYQRSNHGD